jgi:hypothetical protein
MNRTSGTLVLLAFGYALAATAADTAPAPAVDAGPDKPAARSARPPARTTMDRLELGTTSITGNRELPKVMYVVPWKHAEIGDLGGKPLNSLVDEVLSPVDREEFGREISYFRALEAGPKAGVETPVTAGEVAP